MENFKVGECPVCGRVNKPISSTVNDVCTTNRYECVKCKEGYTDYTQFFETKPRDMFTREQRQAIDKFIIAFGAKHTEAIYALAKQCADELR